MQDQPEVAFEADTDAFAQAAELKNFLARAIGKRRICGPEEKRADDPHGFKRLPNDPRLKRLDVNGDVRKFRHASPNGTTGICFRHIVQRREMVWRQPRTKRKLEGRSSATHYSLCCSLKNCLSCPNGQAKI